MPPTTHPLSTVLLLSTPLILPSVVGCQMATAPEASPPVASPAVIDTPSGSTGLSPDQMAYSWQVYGQRFIQADGRVIDWAEADRSTSEGQAYAMLRAVMVDDRATFDRTLRWAENNLQRTVSNTVGAPRRDRLWAWKWGKQTASGNKWGILDSNFASDADIDAITALILAARRWQQPDYLRLAQAKLADLWTASTTSVAGQRVLLPGPAAAFQTAQTVYLNPSYMAPAAFRLFAQVDAQRDWQRLVDSSYSVLTQAAQLSAVQLPGDWVAVDRQSGQYRALAAGDGPAPNIVSRYSFDAYRVWWRVGLDAAWFQAPEATRFLQTHLGHLRHLWQSQQIIPAQIDLKGKPLVTYESTAQYAMLYAAWSLTDPAIARQIYQTKLGPAYRDGLWQDSAAYYTQNLAWLGLVPTPTVSASLLQPANPVP
jgi:endoglucanase